MHMCIIYINVASIKITELINGSGKVQVLFTFTHEDTMEEGKVEVGLQLRNKWNLGCTWQSACKLFIRRNIILASYHRILNKLVLH